MWKRAAAVTAAVGTLCLGAGTASATGGGHHGGGGGGDPVTLADGLAGPLQLDVARNGAILVAQDFGGLVSAIGRKGELTDLVSDPDGPAGGIGGVAAGPYGSLYYSRTPEVGTAELLVRTFHGDIRSVADLGAYEATNNPDQINTYGFEGLTEDCEAQLPPEIGPASYTGLVDAHPYALAMTPFGVLVADAGGNDLLLVDWDRRIHLVAVLAPQPTLVTAEGAAANGLPECVVGSTYRFEPVPTDVELGPRGTVYVTTLPGGPEDPSLGARGSVVKVNPWKGTSKEVATGFAGATNLAISPNGTIFVAELFGGQVSKVVDGAPQPVVALDSPAALEWDRGRLLVTTEVFGSGKVLSVPIRG